MTKSVDICYSQHSSYKLGYQSDTIFCGYFFLFPRVLGCSKSCCEHATTISILSELPWLAWSKWTEWSFCSGQCVDGTNEQARQRTRRCLNADPLTNSPCKNNQTDTEFDKRPCPTAELHGKNNWVIVCVCAYSDIVVPVECLTCF